MASDTGEAGGTGPAAGAEGPSRDRDAVEPEGAHRLLTAWTTGPAGIAVTVGLAGAGAFWPALTVLAGALVASGLLLVRRGGKKRYVLSGVVYCLGLAAAIELAAPALPGAYATAVLPAVGGMGAIAGLLVVAKFGGKRVVKRVAVLAAYDEEYWGEVWDALASFASLLSLVWLLVTFSEKVLRYASVSVGALVLLVANLLGYRVEVTVLGFEVEAVMAMFVGCVLVWFHLLGTLHDSWRAVVRSAEKAQERRASEEDASTGAEG